jgi:hypothetical protein
MKRLIVLIAMVSPVAGLADDDAASPAPAMAATPMQTVIAQTQTMITRVDPPSTGKLDAGSGVDAVRFAAEAKWLIAGYNNNEIVYTIFVRNQDSRIIRCTTQIRGAYFENGKKVDIADRQSTTVFPDQQTQVGNWIGMDEKSGATYSMKCRPI